MKDFDMTAADNSNAILDLLSSKRTAQAEREPSPGNAARPAGEGADPASADQDAKLAEMLSRIQQMTAPEARKTAPPSSTPSAAPAVANERPAANAPLDAFIPQEPNSIREAGLTDSEVES